MRPSRLSILITDDDRQFRETLRELLGLQGFDTLTAADGEEALAIVRASEVHLLMLDMHMPRLTGLETIHRVKQINALLPCILMSARLDEVIRRQAERARAFSVLAKPITRGELTRAVDRAIHATYGR